MLNYNKLFIIAEISANHNNSLDITKKTIDAIASTGANAVKVQTYTADSLTLDVDNEYFGPRKEGLWKGRTLYDLFTEGSLPYEWHAELKEYTESKGLIFFSTPFDINAVDFLDSLDVPIFKIASPEITDVPLIRHVASKNKPVIISTGMASEEDIRLAIETCRAVGNHNITLLKCTSEYPAPPEMANLLTIPDMKQRFGVEVGLSDHTMGSTVPVAAVALGARVIEKHFILDRSLGGPDAAFSMEPDEFKQMVDAVHEAFAALGAVTYELSERNRARRRSLFVAEDIKAGELLTEKNIRSVRPGVGLHPKYYNEVLGKKALVDLPKGTPLSWDHFA